MVVVGPSAASSGGGLGRVCGLSLQSEGLLKFHKVDRHYANRGLLLDGRYPHKSARITALNGEQWAVDPWKTPTGGAAEVMPLKQWYKERNSAAQYE